MCTGVAYQQGGKLRQVGFRQLSAKLPIKKSKGDIEYVCWGRRFQEPGRLPTGSHVLIHDLHQKIWKNLFIKPVKLAIDEFEIANISGEIECFQVTKGQVVQGVLVEEEKEKRVYIVMFIPQSLDRRFEKWPRILVDVN